MPEIIPLQAVDSQTVQVPLSGQNVRLNIYQKNDALFADVFTDGGATLIIAGVICMHARRLVRDLYLGFQGDFVFFDTQGTTDPVSTGLGDRYQLVYILPSELPTGVG